MIKNKNFFNRKWLILAVIFTATVVFLTHLPQETMPSQLIKGGLDKLAHILAYGAITLLFILSLRSSSLLPSTSLLFLAILAVGTIDELTQPFVNRTASLADWLADILGISVVLLSFIYLKCFKHSKRAARENADISLLNS